MKLAAGMIGMLSLFELIAGESGLCSWYGTSSDHHGQPTAFGDTFNRFDLTAAHKTLPKGSTVRVRNLSNGRSVNVIINDRGPFLPGRILDLSSTAFELVENKDRGLFPCDYDMV